ncbi:hypothetical protein Y032_0142g2328 [Ancylostoma ceylanicum]|uniref:Uncharacterized protein n=1 Tax=Ancylostoma ceylanicum TaxID=53326 RepID=A0A016T2P7_9BILA|nr:hypothetical protein Y032_0142g2328 [Ancylostoma ceylanicum]
MVKDTVRIIDPSMIASLLERYSSFPNLIICTILIGWISTATVLIITSTKLPRSISVVIIVVVTITETTPATGDYTLDCYKRYRDCIQSFHVEMVGRKLVDDDCNCYQIVMDDYNYNR